MYLFQQLAFSFSLIRNFLKKMFIRKFILYIFLNL